jgi:glucans biosynthesis protein
MMFPRFAKLSLAMPFLFLSVHCTSPPDERQPAMPRAVSLHAAATSATADQLPEFLRNMDYATYRKIEFRRDQATWAGENLPFQLQFYHRGYIFKDRVQINLQNQTAVTPVKFSPNLFRYPFNHPPLDNADLGFAGLRILAHLNSNSDKHFDEVVSFLGGSYWRAVGAGGVWGASCRGLTINALPQDGPEEHPAFCEFTIRRPDPGDIAIAAFAKLRSESVDGAYDFQITPGEVTTIRVRASLNIKKQIRELGLASMSSMFFYGEGQNFGPAKTDERPEVHDSDGLLIAADSGEFLWRPLHNMKQLRVSRFTGVKSFGLLQRDRNLFHYEDYHSKPERRPSIWIEPGEKWPAGAVELIELPSAEESMDNIVAQYVLETPPRPGDRLEFTYTIRIHSLERDPSPNARVISTKRKLLENGALQYEIEFAGSSLINRDNLAPALSATGEKIQAIEIKRTGDDHCRIRFQLPPAKPGAAIELRAFIKSAGEALSETWSDTWTW